MRALLRVAVLQNIPVAMNRSTADFLFTSPLMDVVYERQEYDYATRLKRKRGPILPAPRGVKEVTPNNKKAGSPRPVLTQNSRLITQN